MNPSHWQHRQHRNNQQHRKQALLFSHVSNAMSEEMPSEEIPVPSADLFKFAAASILFFVALVGGMLPRRLQNVGSKVVSCLNTAAGGVFFASAMVRQQCVEY